MCDVVCEYKDKCTSHPQWCQTCRNNKGKRNYYIPEPYPAPWQPWYPWYQPIWIQTTGSNYYSPQ